MGGLLGLRRGGAEPPATRAGQPLRPLTVPNLIGYIRIALVAIFLVVALGSDDGRVALATACFVAATATDYLDGLLARATGQYSRLGALMDPFIDRMVVVAGVVVTWHFELLPRWALAVLAARELVMVILVAIALRRGLDIEINWIGRISVWPTMTAIAGSLMFESWVAEALLYIGLAGSVIASLLYLRNGRDLLRRKSREPRGWGPGRSRNSP